MRFMGEPVTEDEIEVTISFYGNILLVFTKKHFSELYLVLKNLHKPYDKLNRTGFTF